MPPEEPMNEEVEELGKKIVARRQYALQKLAEHDAALPISPYCFMCKKPFIPADSVGIGIHCDGALREAYHQTCMDAHNAREEEAFRKNAW